MKKTLSTLLLTALLITLCAACETGGTDTSGDASPVEDNTSSPVIETPDGPSPDASSPEPSGNSAPRVKTDYSKLTPYEAPTDIVAYFYEDTPKYLTANSGYGTLVPYIGEVHYGDGNWSSELYGLATLDGKIVCGASYSNIYRMYLYDYTDSTSTPLPIYQLTLNDGDLQIVAAAIDGSWATETSYAWFNTFENGFCGIRINPDYDPEQDDWAAYYSGVDFYDYDGSLIYRSEDIVKLLEIEMVSVYYFAEADLLSDIFPLQTSGDEAWYFDSGFNRLYGPYAYASGFYYGLAAATEDGVNWGYIDAAGNWAIKPDFSTAESFDGHGHAFVRRDGIPMIINKNGDVILSLSSSQSGYIWRTDFGYAVEIWSPDARSEFYDYEVKKVEAWLWLTEQGYRYNGDGVFTRSDEDGLSISDGTKTLYVEGGSYLSGSMLIDGKIALIVSVSYEDNWRYQMPDMDGNDLFPELSDVEYSYFMSDYISDEKYIVTGAAMGKTYNYRWSVMTASGETLISNVDSVYNAYNGMFCVTAGFYTGLMDANGEWVIRISVLNSIPD